MMAPEEHKERHVTLHKALDELAADWLDHQPLESRKLFSNTPIIELMQWSYQQTLKPTEGRGTTV